MFQRGKEVHEPGRKLSGVGIAETIRRASIGSNGDGSMTQSMSNTTEGSQKSSSASRRRVSAPCPCREHDADHLSPLLVDSKISPT